MSTVYVSIGNSDDRLSQSEWAAFASEVQMRVSLDASRVHGYWASSPVSPWQNACICADVPDAVAPTLKRELGLIGKRYRQQSIAWAVAETEFL